MIDLLKIYTQQPGSLKFWQMVSQRRAGVEASLPLGTGGDTFPDGCFFCSTSMHSQWLITPQQSKGFID